MKKIAIYGAGGFGKEVRALIQELGDRQFIGFFDDRDLRSSLGERYLGKMQNLNQFSEELELIIAMGWSHIRQQVVQRIHNPLVQFPSLVSKHSVLSEQESIRIGRGCLIMAGAVLTTDITIGDFSVININASVGHDVQLESFVSIMPGANIAGQVYLSEQAFIGTGATVLNGQKVGKSAIVGAGALVNKSVDDGNTVVGVPARILRKP